MSDTVSVSIRAPRVGAMSGGVKRIVLANVSIRAPRVGAMGAEGDDNLGVVFQSAPPAWGR